MSSAAIIIESAPSFGGPRFLSCGETVFVVESLLHASRPVCYSSVEASIHHMVIGLVVMFTHPSKQLEVHEVGAMRRFGDVLGCTENQKLNG